MKDSRATQPHLSHPSLKHPGRWLWLFLLVPIAFGLARLRFDVEIFDLLPTDLPAVEGLKLYQQYFANARELIISVQAPEAEQGPDDRSGDRFSSDRDARHGGIANPWETSTCLPA